MVDQEKPYDVSVKPSLVREVFEILKELKISPMIKDNMDVSSDTTLSLISNKIIPDNKSKPMPKKVILWSPPRPNWNPWLSKNIDEAPLVTANLKELSEQLTSQYKIKSKCPEKKTKNIAMRNHMLTYAKKDKILDAIRKNSIVIIQGSTGCGKSTQVCQFILDEYIENNRGAFCNIICTQPKKLSAISIATRVALERDEDLGLSVGYSVRFDSILPRSYGAILFCTLGTLLRKMEYGIHGVSHFIVDEIHERSLNNDFLMAVLKDMVNYYPDVKVILMSATLNIDLFHNYFNYCPIIDIKGNCYPVKEYFLENVVQLLNYKTFNDSFKINSQIDDENYSMIENGNVDFKMIEALLTHIDMEIKIPGAVLIFLPGWSIISALKNYLTSSSNFDSSKFCILRLHSKLARAIQCKVFEPVSLGVRKVILSTNIAETSITINDVVFVINYAKSKLRTLTSHNNMIHYDEVWVSKTNMQQRKGRAGRVKPGFCFHLCSKERFVKMENHIKPEIFGTPLHQIALSIKLLQLGSFRQFISKFIEPPPNDAIIKALMILRDIKCIDQNEELTQLGNILAKLPIDPQIGRMMILGNILMLGDALAIIAAASSNMTDLFVFDEDNSMTQIQRTFSGNRCSDHLTVLNAFHKWSSSCHRDINTTNYCNNKMLSQTSLKITKNVTEQLKDLFIKNGFPKKCFERQTFNFGENRIQNDSKLDVLSAILTMGFYPNVCYHIDKHQVYTTGRDFAIIHKTSINYDESSYFSSPFFVFTEKIHTKFVSCKQLSMVTPIHILLFGSGNIKYIKGLVQIDDWIYLKMDPKTASAIVSLRPAIENLILKGSIEPNSILNLSSTDVKLIRILKELCDFNSGRYNLPSISFNQKPNYKRKYNGVYHENSHPSTSKSQLKVVSGLPEKYDYQRKSSLGKRIFSQNSSIGGGEYNKNNLFEVEMLSSIDENIK